MLQSEIKDDYMKKSLEIILLSSIQINDLVNQLLKRQQADEAQAEKHSIQQLLDQVIEVAKDHITLKNIKLSKNYAAQDCKIKIMLHKTVQ
jgi:signal transduction histidine kinase